MPILAEKNICTGCAACYSSCKFEAIVMEEDPKEGFLYPIVDNKKCKSCSACERACPIVTPKGVLKPQSPYACVARNKDEVIRAQSTSGGAFTAIAETILEKGGVVFGASMDKKFKVKHIYVEKKEDLKLFRNSKYVQSEIGDSFKQCKEFLDANRWVCFSGTPCQVKGLIHFLSREYEKLITVDVMCHSGPSPLIFKKYIGYQQSKGKAFDTVIFRDKKRGYSYSNMVLCNGDKEVIRAGSELDPWFRIFLHAHSDRMSCFDCKAQAGVRENDITLWDCWKIKELAPAFDDNKGATHCVVWTQRGRQIFEEAKTKMETIDIPYKKVADTLVRGKGEPRANREQLFKDARELSDVDFINKYFPESIKVKMKSFGRHILLKLHLHEIIRDGVHARRNAEHK